MTAGLPATQAPPAPGRDRDRGFRSYLPPTPGWGAFYWLLIAPVLLFVSAPCWVVYILIPDLLRIEGRLTRAVVGTVTGVLLGTVCVHVLTGGH